MAIIDLRNTTLTIKDGSTNFIDVKVGEGNLTYGIKKNIDLVKSRGELDTTREGEQEAMEVAFSFMWEYLLASTGDPPSIEEVLERTGAASSWISVNPDPFAPYSVHLALVHIPPCQDIEVETILFPMFHYTQLAHSLLDATVSCNGICNAVRPTIVRSPRV